MTTPNPSNVAPWYLRNITQALALDETTGNVFIRTGIDGNVIITGNVSIPGDVHANVYQLGHVVLSGNTLPVTVASGGITTTQGSPASQTAANGWPTVRPDAVPVTGNITSNQSVTLTTAPGGLSSFGYQITGTWTGLIVLEGTVDGTNWIPTTAVPLNSLPVGAFTANGAGQGNLAGLTAIRFRGNTVGSGTAAITLTASSGISSVMQDNLHWSTNIDQLNGNSTSTNNGAADAGTLRVTLANNGTGVVGLSAGSNVVGGITVADGSDVAQGAKSDTAYAGSGSASIIAALKGIYNTMNAATPAGSNVVGGITVADGSDVAQGAKSDTAYAGSGSASIIAALKGIYNTMIAATPAGSNIIGSVLGRTSSVSVTPAVTAGTYTAGFGIGGIMSFPSVFGTAGSGVIQTARAIFKGSAQTGEIDLYVFKASPSNGTYADHAATTWNTADAANLVAVIPMTATKSGLGTMTIYEADGLGTALNTSTTGLYAVAIAVGGLTALASTSDVTFTISALQD